MGRGKPAGFIISYQKRDFGYISVLAILPEFRSRGYARILIRTAMEHLRHASQRSIRIHVEKENTAARKLHESMGFTILGNET